MNCPYCNKEIELITGNILDYDWTPIFPLSTMSKWEHDYLKSSPLPEKLHIGRKIKVVKGP